VLEGICNQIYLSGTGVSVTSDYVVGFGAGSIE
jgi:hypothetical protein